MQQHTFSLTLIPFCRVSCSMLNVRGRSTNWRFLSSIFGVSGTLEKIATLWTETANSWTSLVTQDQMKHCQKSNTAKRVASRVRSVTPRIASHRVRRPRGGGGVTRSFRLADPSGPLTPTASCAAFTSVSTPNSSTHIATYHTTHLTQPPSSSPARERRRTSHAV